MSFGNRDMYMEDATRERRETIKREQGKVLTAQAITEEEAMDDDEETLAATGSEENPVSCMPIMHITPDILDGIPVGPDGRFALYKALDKLTERKPGYWAEHLRQHVSLLELASKLPKTQISTVPR